MLRLFFLAALVGLAAFNSVDAQQKNTDTEVKGFISGNYAATNLNFLQWNARNKTIEIESQNAGIGYCQGGVASLFSDNEPLKFYPFYENVSDILTLPQNLNACRKWVNNTLLYYKFVSYIADSATTYRNISEAYLYPVASFDSQGPQIQRIYFNLDWSFDNNNNNNTNSSLLGPLNDYEAAFGALGPNFLQSFASGNRSIFAAFYDTPATDGAVGSLKLCALNAAVPDGGWDNLTYSSCQPSGGTIAELEPSPTNQQSPNLALEFLMYAPLVCFMPKKPRLFSQIDCKCTDKGVTKPCYDIGNDDYEFEIPAVPDPATVFAADAIIRSDSPINKFLNDAKFVGKTHGEAVCEFLNRLTIGGDNPEWVQEIAVDARERVLENFEKLDLCQYASNVKSFVVTDDSWGVFNTNITNLQATIPSINANIILDYGILFPPRCEVDFDPPNGIGVGLNAFNVTDSQKNVICAQVNDASVDSAYFLTSGIYVYICSSEAQEAFNNIFESFNEIYEAESLPIDFPIQEIFSSSIKLECTLPPDDPDPDTDTDTGSGSNSTSPGSGSGSGSGSNSTSPDSDSDSDSEKPWAERLWWIWVIVGVVVLGAIGLAVWCTRRRSSRGSYEPQETSVTRSVYAMVF